ncbi:MAG: hypothetical protein JJ926_09420 [Roseitalea sp.]|jgi:hypothetical protein|uniref:Uncharacterized protein n=1 Tax=Oceaniradius stylonematis TaxID=2184161 RepID=A0A3A8ADT5_9HYPH|nr:hypothetical protein [Oceaniradius stylonematis]MBO6551530.1 hypothetical protein [Roseitalea sp.]MBO6952090.1 hypothetical protein [Rhizobiaceae bacterium]RNC95512.1 MAG: hypothetical protein ED558_04765 [Oricola sp.]MBO6592064.1 hypothetical protein [Roseitalea sp.]MBO6598319.1 hypothetical protein [Roseitalea sp.]
MTRLSKFAALAAGAALIATAATTAGHAGMKRHGIAAAGTMQLAAKAGGGSAADGYPTPGKAFEACGGAGNVFVMYDELPDGTRTNHSYHCVDE